MIAQNPGECKHCVSYGQLKASYWTIPATSTRGPPEKADKDYIVRVSLAPDVDVAALKQSFTEFCHPRSEWDSLRTGPSRSTIQQGLNPLVDYS